MKKIIGLFKLVIFFSIAAFLIVYLSLVFRPKKVELPNDTTNKVYGFYALEENSMDVLFMGTSHTYYGFNPGVIYARSGLSSYVFAGECQPISVTYYYLKEALKTQNPDLIVLDVFAFLTTSKVCQTDGIIKKNLEDFKLSKNKAEALSLIENEKLLENLFDIAIYKERWNEITEPDFFNSFGDYFNKNFGYTEGYPVDEPIYEREMYFHDEMIEAEEAEMEYLYKIFELTKQNGIEVLLVKTPYYETEEEYRITNYVFKAVEEYGYKTINFNQLYDELDFVFDRDGDVWHCNVRGSFKISAYLSNYILDNYKIFKDQSIYDEQYNQLYFDTLKQLIWTQTNAQNYLEMLKYMDVTILIDYSANSGVLNKKQWKILEEIGIEQFNLKSDYTAVVCNNQLVFSTVGNGYFWEEVTFDDDFVYIEKNEGDVWFYYHDTAERIDYQGINLIVIDNNSQTVIDRVCVEMQNELRLVR